VAGGTIIRGKHREMKAKIEHCDGYRYLQHICGVKYSSWSDFPTRTLGNIVKRYI
jgi:regulation of enolase protein 1 (concanavalin A-like superfamily)